MKFILLIPLLFIYLFVRLPVYAQVATPTFFCVGTNPQPPCATIAPSQGQVTINPPVSSNPSITLSPPVMTQIPTVTPNPCNTQSMNHAMSEKHHGTSGNGLLQQFFKFLLELLQLLFQLLGQQLPPEPSPTPMPTQLPTQPVEPTSTPGVSTGPTAVPNPCPSIAPTTSLTQTPSITPMNPTPTIFGMSPTPVANCQPDAMLVNPCRPWVGAAASGNPGAPKDKISQFTYLESLVARQLDIFRDYHNSFGNSSISNSPLNSDEIHFAQRANTYIDVNWKPAVTWAQADGSDATVNANIDQVAASIKSIAPKKIFLTIWHEPQNDVSAFDNATEQAACASDPTFKGFAGTSSAGSPAQYIAMWQNIENRFNADGVTNVVWTMNYMSYAPYDCMVPMLWPGNNLVDWVIYDTYSRGKTFDQTAGVFYKLLEADSSPTVDFNSKPWGIGEFGSCKQPANGISSAQYYQSVKAALDANTYPKLKMYLVYADTGNNAGMGCLTNYDDNGQQDPTKQTVFNQLFNDPILTAH